MSKRRVRDFALFGHKFCKKDRQSRHCSADRYIGSRRECVTKYTSATVSVASVIDTQCPFSDNFG